MFKLTITDRREGKCVECKQPSICFQGVLADMDGKQSGLFCYECWNRKLDPRVDELHADQERAKVEKEARKQHALAAKEAATRPPLSTV